MHGLRDQRGTDAPAPQIGLDEDALQLGLVRAEDDHGEAGCPLDTFRNDDLSPLDPLRRQFDCLRVGVQLLAIFGERTRGAMLKLFEIQPLVRTCQARPDRKVSEP